MSDGRSALLPSGCIAAGDTRHTLKHTDARTHLTHLWLHTPGRAHTLTVWWRHRHQLARSRDRCEKRQNAALTESMLSGGMLIFVAALNLLLLLRSVYRCYCVRGTLDRLASSTVLFSLAAGVRFYAVRCFRVCVRVFLFRSIVSYQVGLIQCWDHTSKPFRNCKNQHCSTGRMHCIAAAEHQYIPAHVCVRV